MGLRAYRLLIVLVLVWLVRHHHTQVLQRHLPVPLAEVAAHLPEAAALRSDPSSRGGVWVEDRSGTVVGYAARTMPRSRDIIGYAGTTDLLVVLDESWRVLGVTLRSSEDTQRYVEEVARDLNFLRTWTGMTAAKASQLRLGESGFDAVAGATPTSRAVARSVARTLSDVSQQPRAATKIEFRWRDAALVATVLAALGLAFSRHAGRRRLRLAFQAVLLGYFVFVSGDLLALKLSLGWAKSGVPWESVPGLVALLAAALLVPWAARRPLYCVHLCPYGTLQEWVAGPRRWRWLPGPRLEAGLRLLPFALLALALAGLLIGFKLDATNLEPFDAFNVTRQAVSQASLALAVVGLAVSFFVPKAYCKYGCPTGAVLEFVRTRREENRLTRRDAAATGLVLGVAILCALL
jgi:Na+-translocating ferredoxin:NAD+ oxidoreductase RnfG subunit